jgi:glycosyltransferase involved in cell wall biosynthesis
MLSVAQGLSRRGHQVTLVCQPGSRLARRAADGGISPTTVRLRGDFDPLIMARLYRLLRRLQIQLVCANMDKEVRLAGMAAKLAGVPLIRRRGSDMPFPNKLRFRLVDRHLVRRIIVNSLATRETLLRGNPWLRPQKLHLIYNGIAPPVADQPGERERIIGELSLHDATPILAIIGLLKERKGHEILFQALPGVIREFPRTRLLVVGEGELRPRLEALTQQLGIANNVSFLGFRDDIGLLMGVVDAVVLPSANEGFGYVLAEAMSLGRAVVSTNVSSIPEVVQQGDTGLLVPPGNAAALEEALLDLARHPEKARRMGQAGRERVERLFGLERMIDEVEVFFEEVVREVSSR